MGLRISPTGASRKDGASRLVMLRGRRMTTDTDADRLPRMSTSAAPRPSVSIERYLAMEAAATGKHILWDGEVFPVEAMANGTPEHNTLCANVIVALGTALRGTRCRVMTSDQKVWVPHRKGFVYPDATFACGRLELHPSAPDAVTNPSLIVEVLSDGTEKFDRGEKFEGYRSIPSLRHYLMVSSQRVLVEHYTRADDDAWLLRGYGAGDTVHVQRPDLALAVDDLYALAFDADRG